MTVQWFGHACFLISGGETRILTDPFDETVGYPVPDVAADVVLVSHSHGDHANTRAVKGTPVVISTPGHHEANRVRFEGVPTSHDESGGAKRGSNIVFVWTMDDIRLAHCGDLGHVLTEEQVAAIGPVHVLFVPTGGFFTIGPDEAKTVAQQLSARIIFPMHYLTDAMDSSRFPLARVDDFLRLFDTEGQTQKVVGNTVEVRRKDVPESGVRVLVLDYK